MMSDVPTQKDEAIFGGTRQGTDVVVGYLEECKQAITQEKMVTRYLGHAVHDQLLTMSVRPQQIQAAVFKEVDGEEASNLNGISKVELHQVPSNKGIISDQRVGIRRIAGERSRVGLETRSHN